MIRKIIIPILLCPILLLAACEKNPVNRLIDPGTATTGVWGGPWVIYDDEIKTGGGIAAITSMDGQVLDFASHENPHSGTNCIKFSWNGGDILWYEQGTLQHDFSAFIFSVANQNSPGSPTTKDLTPGAYTKISFWVRGSLSANTYLRIEGNNATYQTPSTPFGTNAWMSNDPSRSVTGAWQYYEIPISGSLANTRDFVRIVLRYDEDGNPDTPNSGRGNGGTVFLDDIQLSQ